MSSIEMQQELQAAQDKITQLYRSMGNSIAKLIKERIDEGKASSKNIESDLSRIVDSLSDDISREKVYKYALIALAANIGGSAGSSSYSRDRGKSHYSGGSRSDLFTR